MSLIEPAPTTPVMSYDDIAASFLTTERDVMVRALQHMMWIQTQRLKMGRENELADGLLSSKVSALMNSMFSNAIKIAKLIEPRASDRMNINVGVQVNNTSNELVSRAFAELEGKGVSRDQILANPELVERHIAGQLLGGVGMAIETDGHVES